MRIHILTMSIGNGHNEAARVLAKKAAMDGDDVRIYHPMEMFSPRIFRQIKWFYKQILIHHPDYWRRLINLKQSFLLYHYLPFFLRQPYYQVMKADMILSVHPLLSLIGAEIKKETASSVPLFHVATDFWQSPLLHHPYITARFVPTPQSSKYLNEKGWIFSAGMPIDIGITPLTKLEYCLKHGWNPDKPIIVVSGGGEKMFPFQQVQLQLEELDTPSTILMIGAVERKSQRNTKKGHDIFQYPFTKEFKEFLKISDLLISKAGGMTAAEAIAAEIPTVFYKPLPGHEEGNARLLEQKKVAYWAKNIKELSYLTEKLLNNHSERMKLKQQMNTFIPSAGAERILSYSKYYMLTPMFPPQIHRPDWYSDKEKDQKWPIS